MPFPLGTKIKLWTGGYTNRPAVDPPWLLKIVAVLAFLSVIGALIYIVLETIRGPGSAGISTETAIYVVSLHFVVPITVFYSVTTNSRASRFLILGYGITLYVSTISNKGFLGGLKIDASIRDIVATVVLLSVVGWLFLSPKMRVYYALIAGKEVPVELESRAASFVEASKLNPRVRATLDWLADHLETTVLLGLTALAVYAFVSTA